MTMWLGMTMYDCIIMHDYVWLGMAMYDCIILHDYVCMTALLCMTMCD